MFGFEHSNRERRLCHDLRHSPNEPFQFADTLDRRRKDLIHELSTTKDDRHQQDMRDLLEHTNQFRQMKNEEFFKNAPTALPKGPHTPIEELRAMSLGDRLAAYDRNVRGVFDERVLDDPDLRDTVFRQKDGRLDVDEDNKPIIDEAGRLVFGGKPEENPKDEEPLEIHRKNTQARYLSDTQGYNRLEAEYEEAVRQVTEKLRRQGITPTPRQLQSISFLVNHLNDGYLKGALQARAENGEPLVNEPLLSRLRGAHEKAQFAHVLQERQTRSDWMNIDRGTKERLRREARTGSQNFMALPPAAKWVLGISAGAMIWSAWRSKKSWPKWLLAGGVATYAYLALGKGDLHAQDTMLNAAVKGVDLSVEKVKDLLRKAKLLSPKEDQDYAMHIARVLEGKGFEKFRELATALAAIHGMDASIAASNFHPVGDGVTGEFDFGDDLNDAVRDRFVRLASRNDPRVRGVIDSSLRTEGTKQLFRQAIDDQIRKNRLDREGTYRYFKENSSEIGSGFADICRQVASARIENKDLAAIVEQERNGMKPPRDIDRSRNPAARQAAAKLLAIGLSILAKDFAGKTIMDVIVALGETREGAGKLRDTAQRIDVQNPEWRSTHQKEITLRDRAKKAPDANTVGNLDSYVRADFKEFADNAEQMQILDQSGNNYLVDVLFPEIMGGSEPLTTKLLAIEKLKYGVLVAAANKGGLPIGSADLENVFRADGIKRTAGTIIDKAVSWFNRNLFGITGHFQDMENVASLQAMFKNFVLLKDVKSLEGKNFDDLNKALANYKGRFDRLRDKNQMAEDALRRLGADAAAKLGKREDAKTFLAELYAHPDYQRSINETEKLFALKSAQEIVTAMLTVHMGSGIHQREQDKDNRVITPTEQDNIIAMLAVHYADLVEDGAGRIGGFGQVDAAQAIFAGFKPENVKYEEEITKDGKQGRKEAIASLQRIGALYLILLQSGTLTTENHNTMKTMVKTTHGKMLDLFINRDQKARDTLSSFPSIKEGLLMLNNIYRLIVGEEPREISSIPLPPTPPVQPNQPTNPAVPNPPAGPNPPTMPAQPNASAGPNIPANPNQPNPPSGSNVPNPPGGSNVPNPPTMPNQPNPPSGPNVPNLPIGPNPPTASNQPNAPSGPNAPFIPNTPNEPLGPNPPSIPSTPNAPTFNQPNLPTGPNVPNPAAPPNAPLVPNPPSNPNIPNPPTPDQPNPPAGPNPPH